MDADHPGVRHVTAVVLAAGSGTRMRSQLPKVLQPVAGRPIVLHVLHAIRDAGLRDVVVVVGEQEDRVSPAIEAAAPDGLNLAFVHQPKPLGTADAVLQARAAVTSNDLLVLNGDLALLTAAHLQPLLDAAPSRCALATATVADPTGLGRVVRRSDGTVAAIVEEAVADPATLEIQEINTGIYRFNAAWLWRALSTLEPSKGGETYITDVITNLCAGGEHAPGDLIALPLQQQDGPLNVENRRDLARAEAVMQRRIRERWLDHGVTIVDPAAVYIDADVRVGGDTVLEPGTHLRGRTTIGRDCRIGPNSVIRETRVGDACVLEQCSITAATLGDRVEVGPFSTIRAGTVLDDQVHIGTHAETKEAHLHRGVRMGHFSYVGDAEVGAETNIGAGAITCNFDGVAKHRTLIGERVFIGSNSLLIAPLVIGDDASTGAGAVVNRDVAAGQRVLGHPARARPGRDGERA